METTHKTFKTGDKVRSIYGETLTVLSQQGVMVRVSEDVSGWYHPEKLTLIQRGETR